MEKIEQVLKALRANTEGCTVTEGDKIWKSVYVQNACPNTMSRHQFAGYLSALEKQGLYRSLGDQFFGEVLIAQEVK